MTQEADFHENYKEYLVESSPGEDVVREGVFGPLRAYESPGDDDFSEVREAMDTEEYTNYKDSKMIQAQQGDIQEGIVVGGQVASYIDDMPTVEELIEQIVDESITAYENLPFTAE